MSIRYIELNNEKLKALVEEKGKIVDKGRKHYQNMEKLNEQGIAIAEERGVVIEQIQKLVAESVKDIELGEFDLVATTDIHDGKLRLQIVDRLAQAKANMRAEKDKAERREQGELTEAEVVEEKQAKVLQAISKIPKDKLANTLDAIIKVLK